MKYFAFFVILFIISCSKPDKNLGYDRAMEFVNNYSSEYLQSELFKYSYGPRMGYGYSKNETFLFRVVYRHENSSLLIIDYKEFNKLFPILTDSLINPINIRIGTLTIDDNKYFLQGTGHTKTKIPIDTLQIIINIDTDSEFYIPILQVSKNPIDYFKNLEQKKKKYGILTVRKMSNIGLIQIYFSPQDYLIYFPENFPADTNKLDYWIKKKNEGKRFNKHWHFYHSDKKLDLG